jgi:hypothetical protein
MSDHQIDEAIAALLAAANGRWRKVALVVVKVSDAMGDDQSEGDERYQRVARRIETLVSEGHLHSQGDIKNWHFSEVRLPEVDEKYPN